MPETNELPDAKPSQRVVVLGASGNPERYSHQAVRRLREAGHHPLPVHPKVDTILDLPVSPHLEKIEGPVDTLTVYVNPTISTELTDEILALAPKRVIFNPGSENPELRTKLERAGIEVTEACTLVLLSTAQF